MTSNNFRADYHVHCNYSDDSSTPMKEQILRGIELGLDEICFTDHVDYGIKNDWDDKISGQPLNVNYEAYFKELDEMRKLYGEKIAIKNGLECGVQCHTIEKYNALYEKYRDKLDFMLLSVHQVDDKEFYTQDFQRGKTQEEYNVQYYEELLRVVKSFHNYSVLAHLDLIVRYDNNGAYPFSKVKDIVAEILSCAISDGKGIEINTSSWRYGLKDTQPCRDILRLYYDLGGKIITIGSDSHAPEYLSAHFDEARLILKNEIGFSDFCTFNKMNPTFHKL